MKALGLATVIAAVFASSAAAETRCGWIVNPTPANWWLQDAGGEWIIATQGGAEAAGMDKLPDFTEGEWVVTNGSSYGFGCACLVVKTKTGATPRITRITSVKQLPLKKCLADRKLPRRPG